MLFLGSQEVAPNSYAPEAGLKPGIADSLKLACAVYIGGTRTKNAGGGAYFLPRAFSCGSHADYPPT